MNINFESALKIIASTISTISIVISFCKKLYQVKGSRSIRSTKFIVDRHKLVVTLIIPIVILAELYIIPIMINNVISGDNSLLDSINVAVVIASNFIINVGIILFQDRYIKQKLIKIKEFIRYDKEWNVINNGGKKKFYTFIILPLNLIGTFIFFWLAVFIEFPYMDIFLGVSIGIWGVYIYFLFIKIIQNYKLPKLTSKKIIYIKDKKHNCYYNMVLNNDCYIMDKAEVILICSRSSDFTMTVKKEHMENYKVEYRI